MTILSSASAPSALSARAYLDSLFATTYLDERAAGGTGSETAHRRLIFLASLQAAAGGASANGAASSSGERAQ